MEGHLSAFRAGLCDTKEIGMRDMLEICGYEFKRICSISPDRDGSRVMRCEPQAGYKNVNRLNLHGYGSGAFCRYRIPTEYQLCGVYIVSMNDTPVYVGECRNLSQRHNTGYGQISPRNCYVGGQQTNCRINQLILKAAESESSIALWFLQTDLHKTIEAELRTKQPLDWNRN